MDDTIQSQISNDDEQSQSQVDYEGKLPFLFIKVVSIICKLESIRSIRSIHCIIN